MIKATIMSQSQSHRDRRRRFLGCSTDIAFLKFHPQTEVDPPGSQIIRYSVLLIKDRFYPCVARLIPHLHEVEDFEAQPGIAGEAEKVAGIFPAPFLIKQL